MSERNYRGVMREMEASGPGGAVAAERRRAARRPPRERPWPRAAPRLAARRAAAASAAAARTCRDPTVGQRPASPYTKHHKSHKAHLDAIRV